MLLTWIALFAATSSVIAADSDSAFREALSSLTAANFKTKEQAANALAGIRHPGTRVTLDALLAGQLYYRREDRQVFIAKEDASGLALTNPLTLRTAGTGQASEFARIATNNQLRKAVKS